MIEDNAADIKFSPASRYFAAVTDYGKPVHGVFVINDRLPCCVGQDDDHIR